MKKVFFVLFLVAFQYCEAVKVYDRFESEKNLTKSEGSNASSKGPVVYPAAKATEAKKFSYVYENGFVPSQEQQKKPVDFYPIQRPKNAPLQEEMPVKHTHEKRRIQPTYPPSSISSIEGEIHQHSHFHSGEKDEPEGKILSLSHQSDVSNNVIYPSSISSPSSAEQDSPQSQAHPYPFENVSQEGLDWSALPPGKEGEDGNEQHSFRGTKSSPPYLSQTHSHTPPHTHGEYADVSHHSDGRKHNHEGLMRTIVSALTALIPIGIFMSAMNPNVVVISPNATRLT